jgi:hypothetical protein
VDLKSWPTGNLERKNERPAKNTLIRIGTKQNQLLNIGSSYLEFLKIKLCGAEIILLIICLKAEDGLYWDKNNGENNFSDGELAWTSFEKRLMSYKKNSKAETKGGKG